MANTAGPWHALIDFYMANTTGKLLDTAMEQSWDSTGGGGMLYTFDRDFKTFDSDKLMWPHPEAFSAAFLLAQHHAAAGDAARAEGYMAWYDKLWAFSHAHLIDDPGAGGAVASKGGWFGALDRENDIKINPKYGSGHLKSWFDDCE